VLSLGSGMQALMAPLPINSLSTRRVKLAALNADDSAELLRVRSDPEAMKFWDAPADESIAATAEVVSRLLRDAAVGEAIYWTARLRVDHRFIGLFDLSDIREHDADLGFMMVRAMWGQGLASEACAEVIREAGRLGLTHLRARIHLGNARSERLLRRLGFAAGSPAERVEVRPGVIQECVRFTLELSA
jgi:[ribosomal protein S5]-alanine N-acetyltransferase